MLSDLRGADCRRTRQLQCSWRVASGKLEIVESFEDKLTVAQDLISAHQDSTREVLASPLEAVSKSLDEGLGLRDSGEHTRVLERLFGDYTFDKPQLKVLSELAGSIRGAAVASGAIVAIEIITTLGKALYGSNPSGGSSLLVVGGVPINNVTVMVENGLTAVLLFMAAKSFRKVVESDTNQLRYVFQGLLQLFFVFMQASTIIFCLSVIQFMQAALRWPPMVAWVTAALALLAIARATAFFHMLRKWPPGSGRSLTLLMAMRGGYGKKMRQEMPQADQIAISIIGGLVLPLTMAAEDDELVGGQLHPDEKPSESQAEAEEKATGSVSNPGQSSEGSSIDDIGADRQSSADGSSEVEGDSLAAAVIQEADRLEAGKDRKEQAEGNNTQYEFQPQEEQLLELVMNGMRVSGLALAVEALSSLILGVSTLVQAGTIAQVAWELYNILFRLADQALRASLLFLAAGFFCRAITSSGHDIDNLMAALGSKGLSRLFRQTAKISKGVVMGLITGWGLSAYAVAKQQGWIAIVKSQLGLA